MNAENIPRNVRVSIRGHGNALARLPAERSREFRSRSSSSRGDHLIVNRRLFRIDANADFGSDPPQNLTQLFSEQRVIRPAQEDRQDVRMLIGDRRPLLQG